VTKSYNSSNRVTHERTKCACWILIICRTSRSNGPRNARDRSGVLDLWHSALKCTTECQPPISNELRNANFAVKFACGMPQNRAAVLDLWHSAVYTFESECRGKSNPCHFTSRVPLFKASYLFDTRLLENKIPTPQIF
jgi:hypothetical protein